MTTFLCVAEKRKK